jgi:hypothetical protein
MFVLLISTVEELNHTRDWVGWKGSAAGLTALETNKDVWVLEPIADIEELSIVVPHFGRYAGFDPGQPKWQGSRLKLSTRMMTPIFSRRFPWGGYGRSNRRGVAALRGWCGVVSRGVPVANAMSAMLVILKRSLTAHAVIAYN